MSSAKLRLPGTLRSSSVRWPGKAWRPPCISGSRLQALKGAAETRWGGAASAGTLRGDGVFLPSTSVDTAIRASSWTPPEPAVLWNILSRDAITTSEICSASWCCTFRRTFCRGVWGGTGSAQRTFTVNRVPTGFLNSSQNRSDLL